MAMDVGEMERMIREAIPDAEVKLEDLRGDGDHYAAMVVSATFKGKTRVQQHQIVYQAFALLGGKLIVKGNIFCMGVTVNTL